MKSLEIFSGAGGLAKGLELAGFKHAAFIEFNKHACESLEVNFDKNKVYCGDVRGYDFNFLSDIDVVAGGPPCQPFSLGGKHMAYQDNRDMFPHAIRAIESLSPKAFFFENVKGLLRHSFASYFSYILYRLTFPGYKQKSGMSWQDHLKSLKMINHESYGDVKYRVSYKLLNAADYGVPQCRERVVIIGVRSDIDEPWKFPQPSYSEEQLLVDKFVTGDYWNRHKLPKKQREAPSDLVKERLTKIKQQVDLFEPEQKPWQTVRDSLCDVPDPRQRHHIADHVFRDGARTYPGHTGSDYDLPAKTIKAGGHGVPGGENMIRFHDGSVRYFTVFEAKRIQTFPDEFVIRGAWGEAMRQIGNAVPVVLATQIGSVLQTLLRGSIKASNRPVGKLRPAYA